MIVKLLTEHHLEFLSLNGGCRGSSESTHVKMPHCWKSHVKAQVLLQSMRCTLKKLSCHPYHMMIIMKTELQADL